MNKAFMDRMPGTKEVCKKWLEFKELQGEEYGP